MLSDAMVEHYKSHYIGQIHMLLDTLEKRLLPTFDSIGEEATDVQNEVLSLYEHAASSNEWLDPDQASEVAFNAGMEHFDMVLDIKQGLLNLFAANLFHLFEQQVREFNFRILGLPDKHHANDVLKSWDMSLGNPILSVGQQELLNEISLLAHTVKHGDGTSSVKLFKISPNLFREKWDCDFEEDASVIIQKPPVTAPLFGNGIYVQIEDLRRYKAALIEFWVAIFAAFKKADESKQRN